VEVELSEDQQLFRDTAERFILEKYPLSAVRQSLVSALELSPDYWREVAELGWFSLLVPEDSGGGSLTGSGVADAAIVAELRGRALQPGPFASTNVVAWALAHSTGATNSEVLNALIEGRERAAWVGTDARGHWNPGGSLTYETTADGWVLRGESGLVPEGSSADWLLVIANGADGLHQFLISSTLDGVARMRLESLDPSQVFTHVSFDAVEVPMTALCDITPDQSRGIERQFQIAIILMLADTVGALDVLFGLTRQYALDRCAFGRPIGSFQSIKHQLADMSLSLEAAKAVLAAAVASVDIDGPDCAQIVSMARAWLGDEGVVIAQGCFQIFAGIGFTWEHDSHLFVRRVTMNGLLYGQAEWHRERVCGLSDL
jgi:alkylation response protein AidB-like acyl-CoA dehydrogenase